MIRILFWPVLLGVVALINDYIILGCFLIVVAIFVYAITVREAKRINMFQAYVSFGCWDIQETLGIAIQCKLLRNRRVTPLAIELLYEKIQFFSENFVVVADEDAIRDYEWKYNTRLPNSLSIPPIKRALRYFYEAASCNPERLQDIRRAVYVRIKFSFE